MPCIGDLNSDMPVAQLLSSGIESLLNQLIKLDPDSQPKLKKLHGRSLQVRVRELPWPLLFQFSGHIHVGIVPDDTAGQPAADCMIELNLDTLPLLKDTSQLSQLIQQEKLRLVGDMYVAQSFSSLIKELDIDWEEQLAIHTNDVFAHQTFVSVKQAMASGKAKLAEGREYWRERLTQEDAIGVKPEEFQQFSQQVMQVRSATERLAARLANLERNNKGRS